MCERVWGVNMPTEESAGPHTSLSTIRKDASHVPRAPPLHPGSTATSASSGHLRGVSDLLRRCSFDGDGDEEWRVSQTAVSPEEDALRRESSRGAGPPKHAGENEQVTNSMRQFPVQNPVPKPRRKRTSGAVPSGRRASERLPGSASAARARIHTLRRASSFAAATELGTPSRAGLESESAMRSKRNSTLEPLKSQPSMPSMHRLKGKLSALALLQQPSRAPSRSGDSVENGDNNDDEQSQTQEPKEKQVSVRRLKGKLGSLKEMVVKVREAGSRTFLCKDLHGKLWDIAELRQCRLKAIEKGMTFIFKYLCKDNFEPLYEIGDDAPNIFFEIWYTTSNSRLRTIAKGMAKVLLEKLEAKILARPLEEGNEEQMRDDFFECMFMLRCNAEMEFNTLPLLARADQIFYLAGFKDTELLFGAEKDSLAKVATDPWLMLLMRILIMEFNNLIWPGRWTCRYGLKEAFIALRQVELKIWTDPPGDFQDSFYLATHITYAMSAYSGIKVNNQDCPWVYRYIRKSYRYWMKQDKLKRTQDPSTYVDVDGIGEIIDCLRGLGLTEASDAMVCDGTIWLVENQMKGGNWPVTFQGDPPDGDPVKLKDRKAYDAIHSSWVCTQALRDRDFQLGAPASRKWAELLERLIRQTNFSTLAYEARW